MIDSANKLARDYGYAGAKDCNIYFDGKRVFIAYFDEVRYTGLPQFILVSEEKKADFAMPVENEKVFAFYASTGH